MPGRDQDITGIQRVPGLDAIDPRIAADQVVAALGDIRCPVLLLNSREDHVVDPVSGDVLEHAVGGTVDRVMLERSFHVATLDYDKDEIETRSVRFVTGLLAPAGA